MSESQGWELKNPWGSVLLMEKQRGGFSITLKAGKFNNISSLTLFLTLSSEKHHTFFWIYISKDLLRYGQNTLTQSHFLTLGPFRFIFWTILSTDLNRWSLGDFTRMEGTQKEMFNFLWLIWVHYLPLTPTKKDWHPWHP